MGNRKNSGLGIVLMTIGVIILLGLIGVHLGGLIPLALGLALMYWGFKKYQRVGGLSAGSIVLFIIGGLFALSGVGALIPFFIASLLLYFGYRSIKSDDDSDDTSYSPYQMKDVKRKKTLDEEFNHLMNKQS
ncbi:LiaF transmembrane domain-containing protein [Alkalihalobacillus sp. NPDC078783]